VLVAVSFHTLSKTKQMNNLLSFKFIKNDFPSGLVVFLVALPLCLGIALASGAPLFSGIIAGIIGGLVVGFLSNSQVSVSGPAAGLTAIVLSAITTLGSFELFLLAVVLAGAIQMILGIIKAGTISNYFPNNVIEGMLAGIGVIIFLKQIPHAIGYDKDAEGDFFFEEKSGGNSLTSLLAAFESIHIGATLITIVALAILILWDKISFLKNLKLIPGALVAVISGILLNNIFIYSGSSLAVQAEHLVILPVVRSFTDFTSIFIFPDFTGLSNYTVWVTAATIAIVASIETLLCIEAGDRMDLYKRYSNPNKELKAQGVGNMLSGLIGGLPMTSVVVRTSANINSGARTKLSTVLHGGLLLVSVMLIPTFLNMIPLATLAAILLLIGYKLASPEKVKHFWAQGIYQFLPFIVTLLAVVFIDLLKGVAIGMIISFIFILIGNAKKAYFFKRETYHDGDVIHIDLAQEVSFLNKAAIKLTLQNLPENAKVIIDASNSIYIAHDVLDLIREFKDYGAVAKNIDFGLIGFDKHHNVENSEDVSRNVWIEDRTQTGSNVELIKTLVKEK
jgi:MFS superfamily sulfate permease-like transporter